MARAWRRSESDVSCTCPGGHILLLLSSPPYAMSCRKHIDKHHFRTRQNMIISQGRGGRRLFRAILPACNCLLFCSCSSAATRPAMSDAQQMRQQTRQQQTRASGLLRLLMRAGAQAVPPAAMKLGGTKTCKQPPPQWRPKGGWHTKLAMLAADTQPQVAGLVERAAEQPSALS
jgi:hypothetical protein